MNKNTMRLILVVVFGIQLVFFGLSLFLMEDFDAPQTDAAISMHGADVIVFLTDGFSKRDLQNVAHFIGDLWGARITLAGLIQNVTADDGTQFRDLSVLQGTTDVMDFDGIYIPGGNISSSFIADVLVSTLLRKASRHNLVIAACGEGILVQASSGLLNGKKFTSSPQDVSTIVEAGGIYVENSTVVIDGNVISATDPNYEELSYAIANSLGYSYTLNVNLKMSKENSGWNYSLIITISDKRIVDHMNITLSRVETQGVAEIGTFMLKSTNVGDFRISFGVLSNGDYIVDCKTISIFNRIESRERISEFSVGVNQFLFHPSKLPSR
ncbi:MAG: DJ-1/PfpI family protein [Candidatus Heimdallarchaeota archaeon]